MKKIILAAFIVLASTGVMADKQMLGDGITQAKVEAAKGMIRYSGYTCDSVDSMRSLVWSAGFSVVCNGFRYSYELKDIGGNWRVYVK
jgi:hypothetical protein